MKSNSSRRLLLITGVFVLIGLLLAAKLFFTQIIIGENYRQLAARQHRQLLTSQTFDRGSIFFEDKNGALVSGATLQANFILAINPTQIIDSSDTFNQLKIIWPALGEAEFTTKAARASDPYEEIADQLTATATAAIRALELPGVQIIEEPLRFYPGGQLAAQTLGFMGYEGAGTVKTGRYGLEKQYNEFLSRADKLTFATFLAELFSTTVDPEQKLAVNHGDLILTIEPKVQRFLEDQLETVMEQWQTKTVGGIILEPKTGALLALAARPAFDPGQKQSDLSVLINPLIERVYEMGSVLKPLTVAAGLDAGVISEQSDYFDAGQILIDDRIISNYDGRARGRVPIQEILNQSLNTGAVFIMQKLGPDQFQDYFDRFNLGQKTGIALPGELKGLTGNLTSRREVEFATASFGQGIALTPLNLAAALSTLANDGYLVQPQVVKRFRYDTGLIENAPLERGRAVIKTETAKQVTAMLVKTVDEVLDGGRARLPNYQVAAKTGTAQIPRADGQGYEPDKFLHSFFGYFPASAPRFSVFLYALEPIGAAYASQTLTAPFSHLAKFLLSYYQVPPDRL